MTLLTAADLNRLKWRCRRGMLENDLLIERFFTTHGDRLTARDGAALMVLMELTDNDLLDLLLARREPDAALVAVDGVTDVLARLRPAGARHAAAVHASIPT